MAVYFQEILKSQFLVAYWRLNESANTYFDSAGRFELNGILEGAKPELGGALIMNDPTSNSIFAGKNKPVIEVPNAEPLKIIGGAISVEAWIVHNDTSSTFANNSIVNKTNSFGTANPFRMNLFGPASGGLGGGNLLERKLVFAMGNGSAETVLESAPLPPGVPLHVVGTLFKGKLRLMINGQVVASTKQEVALLDSGEPLYIGGRIKESSSTNIFNGLLSELAIYKNAMSQKTAERHYNIGRNIVADTSHITTFDRPSYS